MESNDFIGGQPTPPNILPSDIGLNKALLQETNA